MAVRPAKVYNGSTWDDIGDSRVGQLVTDVAGKADASALATKSNNPKSVDTKTANYTLVLGDLDKIIQMNATGGTTITVPTNANVAFGDGAIIHVANINTGTLTIAGASGVTVNQAGGLTLARWESGTLYRRATDSWVFLKGGGLGAANFSNTATGTYSSSGKNYKFVTFTASGTLTITQEGFIDVYVLAGGGGVSTYAYCNAQDNDAVPGGDGGSVADGTFYIPSGAHTVTVGAGGSGIASGGVSLIGSTVRARGGGPGVHRGNRGGLGASGTNPTNKNGTAGRATTLRNTTETHGGGGGAGSGYSQGPGTGTDGGANGRAGTGGGAGISAAANRGGGAGGPAWRFCNQGTGTGNGGSGIIIVRVEV